MAGRLQRSWDLVKASAAVLRSDKQLLLFPLLSGLCALIVSASFLVPLAVTHVGQAGDDVAASPLTWLVLFAFYVVQYAVIFFFNSALVGAATMRLNGQVPTLADGFRIAGAHLPAILGYAVIAATVGIALRALQERAGWIGRLVIGLIGMAWTVATFLAVPVLVNEGVGPIDAVKRSAELLKRTWGENLVGTAGMGLVFGLATFGVLALGIGATVLLAQAGAGWFAVAPAALTVVALVLLVLVQAALQGVYSAALYRYAATGQAGGEFDQAMIADAFRVKA